MDLDVLDIILGATAAVSFITMLRMYYINKKISKEEKKHKCVVGTIFCNDTCCYHCEGNYKCKMHCQGDPLTCGNAREE